MPRNALSCRQRHSLRHISAKALHVHAVFARSATPRRTSTSSSVPSANESSGTWSHTTSCGSRSCRPHCSPLSCAAALGSRRTSSAQPSGRPALRDVAAGTSAWSRCAGTAGVVILRGRRRARRRPQALAMAAKSFRSFCATPEGEAGQSRARRERPGRRLASGRAAVRGGAARAPANTVFSFTAPVVPPQTGGRLLRLA